MSSGTSWWIFNARNRFCLLLAASPEDSSGSKLPRKWEACDDTDPGNSRPMETTPALRDPTGSFSPGGAGKVAQTFGRDGATVVSSWPAAGRVTVDVPRLHFEAVKLRWEVGAGGYGHLSLPLAWSSAPQWPGGGWRDEPGEPRGDQSELLGAKGASGELHLLLHHLDAAWQQANFLAPQAVIWSGKYVELLKNNCQICARYIPQLASGLKHQSWENIHPAIFFTKMSNSNPYRSNNDIPRKESISFYII